MTKNNWDDLELFIRNNYSRKKWGKRTKDDDKKYLHEYYLKVLKPKRIAMRKFK